MKVFRLAMIVAAVALAAAALAACGSSDSSGTTSAGGDDEAAITEAVTQAATSKDPSICTQYQTQAFTEQTSGGTGEEAVKACEADAGSEVSVSVDVSNVSVDGDSGSADATFTGGFIDGQTLELGMAKEGDQWKVDKAVDLVDFDRDAFVKSALATVQENAPKSAADCLEKSLNNADDDTLKNVILTADGGQALFTPCIK